MKNRFQENERAVTTEEGMALAEQHNCLFFECSAKTQANVKQCFKELTAKVCFLYPVMFIKLKRNSHHSITLRNRFEQFYPQSSYTFFVTNLRQNA